MNPSRHVAVIGAGVAGLTAAYRLSQAGCAVSLYEQLDQIGGLARSIHCGTAPLERYYHFICGGDEDLKRLVEELDLGPRLHWLPAHTSYYVSGALYPFTTPWDILRFSPLSVPSRLRFGLHSAHARRFTDWGRIEHRTAEEWLVSGMGREAYETVWLPLLRMKFGAEAGRVSAPWIWHRIHRVATSRKSLLRPEELGYLEGGSRTLFTRLVERIEDAGGAVHLSQPVRSLWAEGGRLKGVVTDEGEVEADAVISTVPLPILALLLPPEAEAYRRSLEEVQFLGVVCLLLRLERHLTGSFWVNVNDPRAPFNGVVEYSNLNPWRETGGSEVAYIPLYMRTEDPRFLKRDSELAEEMMAGLEALFPPFDRSQVIQWLVTRDSYAQALCPPRFGERVPALASPLPGLYLTDSTQLYPADRHLSGMIGLAGEAVRQCVAGL